MNEKLEYIENVMKTIDENIDLNTSNVEDKINNYENIYEQALAEEDYAKALGCRLSILDIVDDMNDDSTDDGYNHEHFINYTKILDLYIKLGLYEEAYDFCIEAYDKEYDLSDGYVNDGLIHLYKYIPCLRYALQMEEEYEEASKDLYNTCKQYINEELDGDFSYLGDVYFSGSKVYVLLKEYDKALEFFRKAREYYNKSEAEYGEKGMLTPELKALFKRHQLDFCDAMIEIYTLTNLSAKVEKYSNRKKELLETNE